MVQENLAGKTSNLFQYPQTYPKFSFRLKMYNTYM